MKSRQETPNWWCGKSRLYRPPTAPGLSVHQQESSQMHPARVVSETVITPAGERPNAPRRGCQRDCHYTSRRAAKCTRQGLSARLSLHQQESSQMRNGYTDNPSLACLCLLSVNLGACHRICRDAFIPGIRPFHTWRSPFFVIHV